MIAGESTQDVVLDFVPLNKSKNATVDTQHLFQYASGIV